MTTTSRYAQITVHMERYIGVGGALIGVFTLAAVVHEPVALMSIVAMQLFLLVGNIAYNRRWLDRFGLSGDLTRSMTNTVVSAIIGHLSHWPMCMWFTLPLTALVTDPFSGKVGPFSLTILSIAFGLTSFLDGASWHHALAFITMAWFCFAVAYARGNVVTSMLVDSDSQRTELEAAHRRLKRAVDARDRMEVELRQAQKLEAVGRLAAGVAHEINTPIQFVSDSIHFVKNAIDEALPLMELYKHLRVSAAKVAPTRALADSVAEAEERADLDYLVANMPTALERSLDGLSRITTIVRSLKEFAHPDSKDMAPTDLNRAIESTLHIAKHEYKLVADLDLQFAKLPAVTCHAGEINQVVLNIVVNAAHAIEDVVKDSGNRGTIRVATVSDEQGVVITIGDSGGGIPEAVQERMFEPFFTTKEVGRGTGQGLAIAKAVVDRHGGKLTFTSELGRGTVFSIRLPLVPPPRPMSGAFPMLSAA